MTTFKNLSLEDRSKIIIIIIFLVVLFVLTYYFMFILNTTVIISHFYYIPVILSCFWWQKKGLIITFILGGVLLLSPLFQGSDVLTLTSIDNILRTMFLIVIGIVVSILSVRSAKSKNELRGRVRELNCLYGITKVISNPNTSIDEIFSSVLNRIKCALQHPNMLCIDINYIEEYPLLSEKQKLLKKVLEELKATLEFKLAWT